MLGRTNTVGGGGGSGATLTVTAPANVTVTVSKDNRVKTKTSDADGIVIFKGLETGTWSVEISDGSQTSVQAVDITADFSITIHFFSAQISVTYPEGSTCTCESGSTKLTAPTTTGSYTFTVPFAGTWTVSSTNGTSTATDTVTVTEDGQSESVTLTYIIYLFKDGTINPEFYNDTLKWTSLFYVHEGVKMNIQDKNMGRKFNAMDITHANRAEATITGSWNGNFNFVLYDLSGGEVAKVSGKTVGEVLTLDISSFEGQYAVGFYATSGHANGEFNVNVNPIAIYY